MPYPCARDPEVDPDGAIAVPRAPELGFPIRADGIARYTAYTWHAGEP